MKIRKLLLTLLALSAATCTAVCFTACNINSGSDNTGNGGNGGNGGNKTEHTTHTYDQKTATATYLKTAADCTHKAVYYYSCTCGEKGEETFEFGEANGHTFNKEVAQAKYLVSEADYTHKAVYYKSCECGEKGTETFEYGEVKKDENKNAYQEVIDLLQAKLDDKYDAGAEILTVHTLGNYLGCKVKFGNAIKTVRVSSVTKNWLDENGNITDYDKANRLITNATLRELDGQFVGLYLSDSKSATDKALVKEMIENRVGTDYDIIYGGVSAVTDVADDYLISNAAKFTVYTLIADNDGKVYEYTETLIATKDNGNVYDTVIGGGSFRSETHTQTELGGLANNYYAVMQK